MAYHVGIYYSIKSIANIKGGKMTTLGFFQNCLGKAISEYKRLLNTPRSRGGLQDEVKDIVSNINRAVKGGELTADEGKELIEQFKKIDFSGLAQARAELKRAEKQRKVKNGSKFI